MISFPFFNTFGQKSTVESFDCENILRLVGTEEQREIFCNEEMENDSFNDTTLLITFVLKLFCNQNCLSPASLIEDYFGISSLETGMINYNAIPAVLEFHERLNQTAKEILYQAALDFYSSCIKGNYRINKSCYLSNVFFMILKDKRLDEKIGDTQIKQLFIIYELSDSENDELADMVLDTLRLTNTECSQTFIKNLKFRSTLFTSDEMIELHKRSGDQSYMKFL
jgi:hypothetical protein